MSLSDALRKAASLLVETDAAPQSQEENTDASASDDPLARVERQALDVDELLREQGIGVNKGQGSTSSVGPTTRTVEEVVQHAPGPDLKDVAVDASTVSTGQALQPQAIYEAAKLEPAAFSAEQMLEMLAGLPPELPLDVKRQTVKVTLSALGKTVGATPDSIVADASRKMAALKSYVDFLHRRTDEFSKSAEAEIAALQKQIEEKRAAIDSARAALATTTQSCITESQRLDDVLEFFSLDVPPSKYAPKTLADAPGQTPAAPPSATPKTQA